MAKIEILWWPSSSQGGEDSGGIFFFFISTIFARAASQIVSLPSNLPRNMVLLPHFLVCLTLTLNNFCKKGGNGKIFVAIINPVK